MGNKEKPKRGPNEALLQIKRVGVCGTDLHAYTGNQPFFSYPRILGHELAAEVIDMEENSEIRVGDKVVPIPYVSCGKCIACKQGKTNCCANIQVLGVHIDGGMQELFVVPNELLLKANHLSFDQMAVVEPLAIGVHAVRRAEIGAGEFVVVIGCGPIGLGIMKFALLEGSKVIAIDFNEERLNYARDQIGVDHIVNGSKSAIDQVVEITNGELASAVFDATGNKQALESGPEYMAHGGKFVLVGLSIGTLSFSHPKIHAKESSILCSRNATRSDFEKVMDVLNRDLFPIGTYITHRLNFDEVAKEFETLTDPKNGVIKATIDLNHE